MHTFYKHVKVDHGIPEEYIKYVVGKKGAHLKTCCKHTGVHSVWMNPTRRIIQIYGPVHNLDHAARFMEKHLQFVRSLVPAEESEKKEYEEQEYDDEDVCIVAHLDGVLSKDDVKHLIGKRGAHFKQFTKLANVSFIWYDEEAHSVSVWGPKDHLPIAVHMLFDHIDKIHSTN